MCVSVCMGGGGVITKKRFLAGEESPMFPLDIFFVLFCFIKFPSRNLIWPLGAEREKERKKERKKE